MINLIKNDLNSIRSMLFVSAVVVFVLGLGSFAFSNTEGEIKRLDESVLDVEPIEPFLVIPENRVFPEKYVEAGYFPTYVGDEIFTGYDVALSFSGRDKKTAMSLEDNRGYGEFLNQFVSGKLGLSWFRFLKGKPLALIVDDLKAAKLNAKKFMDVKQGIYELFHIKLETPEYQATFPKQAFLYVKLIDHDIHIHNEDIVFETCLSLTAKGNGDYYLTDPTKTISILKDLVRTAGEVVGVSYFTETSKGKELKLARITGVIDQVQVEKVPRIEGVVMTHKVFVGSTLFESGWQWFGRPEGLYGAQQDGFVQ